MSGPKFEPAAGDTAETTTVHSDAARQRAIRERAAAVRAESRQAQRRAAQLRHESNAILDTAALLVTEVLQRQRIALLAPVVARFRGAEGGHTGVAVAGDLG